MLGSLEVLLRISTSLSVFRLESLLVQEYMAFLATTEQIYSVVILPTSLVL
jgi:hypothetical protein